MSRFLPDYTDMEYYTNSLRTQSDPDILKNHAYQAQQQAAYTATKFGKDGQMLHGFGPAAALSAAGFGDYATSEYRVKSISGPSGVYIRKLTVKTLQGKTIQINNVDSSTPIADVKQQIEDKEGIPVDSQKLIFNGKTLGDEQTLGDYEEIGLRDESNLHLVVRRAGGGRKKYTKKRRGYRRRSLITHKTSRSKSKLGKNRK